MSFKVAVHLVDGTHRTVTIDEIALGREVARRHHSSIDRGIIAESVLESALTKSLKRKRVDENGVDVIEEDGEDAATNTNNVVLEGAAIGIDEEEEDGEEPQSALIHRAALCPHPTALDLVRAAWRRTLHILDDEAEKKALQKAKKNQKGDEPLIVEHQRISKAEVRQKLDDVADVSRPEDATVGLLGIATPSISSTSVQFLVPPSMLGLYPLVNGNGNADLPPVTSAASLAVVQWRDFAVGVENVHSMVRDPHQSVKRNRNAKQQQQTQQAFSASVKQHATQLLSGDRRLSASGVKAMAAIASATKTLPTPNATGTNTATTAAAAGAPPAPNTTETTTGGTARELFGGGDAPPTNDALPAKKARDEQQQKEQSAAGSPTAAASPVTPAGDPTKKETTQPPPVDPRTITAEQLQGFAQKFALYRQQQQAASPPAHPMMGGPRLVQPRPVDPTFTGIGPKMLCTATGALPIFPVRMSCCGSLVCRAAAFPKFHTLMSHVENRNDIEAVPKESTTEDDVDINGSTVIEASFTACPVCREPSIDLRSDLTPCTQHLWQVKRLVAQLMHMKQVEAISAELGHDGGKQRQQKRLKGQRNKNKRSGIGSNMGGDGLYSAGHTHQSSPTGGVPKPSMPAVGGFRFNAVAVGGNRNRVKK